jgi:hypothetical protein
MTTNTIFSCLSTRILLNTNEYTDDVTLQVFHGGISVAFNEDSPQSILFLRDVDNAIDHCMGNISKDEDLKYARKVISLCSKFCNIHG